MGGNFEPEWVATFAGICTVFQMITNLQTLAKTRRFLDHRESGLANSLSNNGDWIFCSFVPETRRKNYATRRIPATGRRGAMAPISANRAHRPVPPGQEGKRHV